MLLIRLLRKFHELIHTNFIDLYLGCKDYAMITKSLCGQSSYLFLTSKSEAATPQESE